MSDGTNEIKQGSLGYFPDQVNPKRLHRGRLVAKEEAVRIHEALTNEPAGLIAKDKLSNLGIASDCDLLLTKHDGNARIFAMNNGPAIGKGAFGEVRVVQDVQSGEYFAAKIMNCKILTEQAEARFKSEDDKLAMVGQLHGECTYLFPNNDGVKEGRHASIMTLAPGKSLGDWTRLPKASGLSAAEKCHVMSESARLVAELHENHGVLHRDIKPDNIHYDRKSGIVSLIDFGTAVKMENGHAQAGLAGTPIFMPPPQREMFKKINDNIKVDSQLIEVTPHTDAYSLAVTGAEVVGYLAKVVPAGDKAHTDIPHYYIRDKRANDREIPSQIISHLHAMAESTSPVDLHASANFFDSLSKGFAKQAGAPLPAVEQVAIFDAKAYLDADKSMQEAMKEAVKTNADSNDAIHRVILIASDGELDMPAMQAVRQELELEGSTVSATCFSGDDLESVVERAKEYAIETCQSDCIQATCVAVSLPDPDEDEQSSSLIYGSDEDVTEVPKRSLPNESDAVSISADPTEVPTSIGLRR